MQRIANLRNDDKLVLFNNTAEQKSMHPSIIEKDFWVCFTLDYLFHRFKWKDALVFKGGTSLSKAFHVIDRFSEDIDLILDWRLINDTENDPWDERSRTQQDKFNKHINFETSKFLIGEFIPTMLHDLDNELSDNILVKIDPNDSQTINFSYPQLFPDPYIRPEIRLEIGPLAEWLPHHEQQIMPYIAEKYYNIFEKPFTLVQTIDAERTFWEKATILHKVANRNTNLPFPRRYSRHYYDLYCLDKSDIKATAFEHKELLKKDVAFKKKFYYSGTAGYDTAKIGTLQLMPQASDMFALETDYNQMEDMIFGETPEFQDIVQVIKQLQYEINCQ